MTTDLAIQRYSGDVWHDYLPEIARLRIEVFRAFPYLYDGDMDYELDYLQTYLDCPRAVIVLARDGERIVGASTGLPLADEVDEFTAAFRGPDFDVDRIFYCGESVLEPAYRGLGVGVEFFAHREAHARELGGFDWYCFCAVERPDDHPLRPADYTPLDRYWHHRGYTRRPEIHTTFDWKDLGDHTTSTKKMTFWLKHATAPT